MIDTKGYESIECVDRDAWLDARLDGITSTDASAIVGESPYKSAMDVASIKMQLTVEPDLSDNEAVMWGTRLEDVVANHVNDVTGRCISDPGPFTIQRSCTHPHMLSTIDRVQRTDGDDRGLGILEVKTMGHRRAKLMDGEPLLEHQIQVQHQLAVTGLRWASIAILIGGQQFRLFDIERDDEFIDRLIDVEGEFWRNIQAGIMPDPDGSESCSRMLTHMYPDTDGSTVELPMEANKWDFDLTRVKAEIASLTKVKREMENRLKNAIGTATYGYLPGGVQYSWKTSERAGYTVKPTTVRTLRRTTKEKQA